MADGSFDNLTVYGEADIAGGARVAGDLTVGDRSAGLIRALNVNGLATIGGLTVDAAQPSTLGGALAVVGATTLNDLTVNSGKPTVLGGTLKVARATTLSSLSVTGQATLGTLRAGGSVVIGGATTLSSSLTLKGPLGIGTAAPTNKLHVFHTGPGLTIDGDQFPGFRIALNGETVAMAQVRTDEHKTLDFGAYGETALKLITSNQGRILITPSGDIGVGIAQPRAKLHIIYGGDDRVGLRLQGGANDAGIDVRVRSSGAVIQARSADGSGAPSLSINPDGGNVGIGTAVPRSRLHIEGDVRIRPPATDHAQNALSFDSAFGDQELFLHRYNTGYAYQDLAVDHNLFPRIALGATNEHFFLGTRTAHELILSTSDTPRLVVDASGNVGIGTTNPRTKLDVSGDLALKSRQYALIFDGSINDSGSVLIQVPDGLGGILVITSSWQSSYDNTKVYHYMNRQPSRGSGTQVKLISELWAGFDGINRSQVVANGTNQARMIELKRSGGWGNIPGPVAAYVMSFV